MTFTPEDYRREAARWRKLMLAPFSTDATFSLNTTVAMLDAAAEMAERLESIREHEREIRDAD